jgi:hypothetical protein
MDLVDDREHFCHEVLGVDEYLRLVSILILGEKKLAVDLTCYRMELRFHKLLRKHVERSKYCRWPLRYEVTREVVLTKEMWEEIGAVKRSTSTGTVTSAEIVGLVERTFDLIWDAMPALTVWRHSYPSCVPTGSGSAS